MLKKLETIKAKALDDLNHIANVKELERGYEVRLCKVEFQQSILCKVKHKNPYFRLDRCVDVNTFRVSPIHSFPLGSQFDFDNPQVCGT